MSQQDGGKRPQWTGRRDDAGDLPNFADDRELDREMGQSRTPMGEMRDYSFFGPDDDLDEAEPEREARPQPARPAAAPPARDLPPPVVVPDGQAGASAAGGLSAETALLLIVGFFAIGGLALIVVGFLLGGIAGGLLVLVGLATLVATGFGFWQERQGGQGRAG